MNKQKLTIVFIVFSALFISACGILSSQPTPAPQSLPVASVLPPLNKEIETSIRFLENRVKKNPDDFVAYNLLAERYIKLMNETNNLAYLELASKAVKASLEISPKEWNLAGLTWLGEVEYASHDFVNAAQDAKLLIQHMPDSLAAYQILADSLIELGDYEKADRVYKEMEKKNDYSSQSMTSIQIRLSRVAFLKGQPDLAEQYLLAALNAALDTNHPSRERVAWCRWQLGDLAFSLGNYEKAKQHYNDALTTHPDHPRTLASLGRLNAIEGDFQKAIENYKKAINILPEPAFVAALGDVYKLAGQEKEASQQYELVEQIEKLSTLNGALYNRQLNLFYADHDIKVEEAYENAAKEYQVRRDIYGADTLAWTALKAGKCTEAKNAIKEALRLETKDAKLFYHAAMIARACGDKTIAHQYLEKTLKLNPKFDLLQSSIAQKALTD